MKSVYPFALLLILDGWGEAPSSLYNAITLAKTPHIDSLYASSASTFLAASGEDVGLPKGTIGNSEVGHLNIGAGRVVPQEILRISDEIANGKFFQNHELVEGMNNACSKKKKIHLLGLISDALVHSSLQHLFALMKLCAELGINDSVYIHCITDGRDTPIDSSYRYLNQIQDKIKEYHTGTIATIMGRYFAMDRDQRWDRIEKAYQCLTQKDYTSYTADPFKMLHEYYAQGIYDEFIPPFRIAKDADPLDYAGLVEEGDTVIFFNFREDRARELTKAFIAPEFSAFQQLPLHPYFITMTEYEKGLCDHVAFSKELVHDPITKVISDKGSSVFKIAETEKYAHITYFFNGGREEPFSLEDSFLIPSLKIPTYDVKPSMRVYEITQELVQRMKTNAYKLLVANFANADMVGHTGNMQATIQACEYIDACIGILVDEVYANNGVIFITADHGNAEEKYDPIAKQILTKHTTNPVPFIIASKEQTKQTLEKGKLADIAPTILNALGLERSYEMTGNILI